MKLFLIMSKEILKKIKGRYLSLFTLSFFSLIAVVFTLIVSMVNKITIDEVFYNKRIDFLFHRFIYVLIGVYVFSICFNLLNNYLTAKLYSRLDGKLKVDYYDKVLRLSYYFHNEHESSDIYYRMFNDITTVVKYFLDVIINVPTKILYLAAALFIMSKWSTLLTLIYVGILILNIVVIIFIRKPNYKISARQKKIEQGIITKITSDLNQIFTIKVFGIENFSSEKMKCNFNEYIKSNVHNNFILSLLNVLNSLSSQIWSLLLIIVGALQVYNNSLSIGGFVAFSSIAASTTNFIVGLINYIFTFQPIKLSYERYNEYIKHEEIYSGDKSFAFENKLSVKSLRFSYPKSKKIIIRNLNFETQPNKIICIVGENGKGKSTFANLLSRLITPPNNSIYIDGVDINKIDYSEYKRNVGYLMQKPIMFSSSIRENIVLDKTDIKEQDIMQILSKLDMQDLINSLPKKLDTVIGENGYKLSQGNIQKISIARVLLRDYKILILDEPTAALDTTTKFKFKKLIQDYSKRALVFIITHDKSEIDLADYILDLSL